MSPVSGIQAALYGLEKSLDHFDETARRIARDASGGDLPGNLVSLSLDKAAVQANAAVIRTGDELIGSLLDVLR